MNLKHIGTLLGKEFLHGPKNYIFVMAIVMPIVISLLFSLLLGTFFTGTPKLGIADEGSSQLVTMFEQQASISTKEYGTVSELKQAVESGAVDMGIVLPDGFDSSVKQGKKIEITAYTWGESLAKNRIILGVTIANLVRELTGQEAPVDIETITLGDEVSIPWSDRLLPLVVLMAIFLGGLMLPSTSLINEKEKKTFEALVITPASVGDILAAKGLLGLILSLFMGVVILILNQAFGAEPVLLVMVLALGAIMAVEVGLLLGILLKDVTTLFAVWKTAGILLFGPAIVYMFPQIPQWVGRIFPTYYLLQPIVEISQKGGAWPEIATEVFILIGINIALIAVLMLALRRTKQFAV